MCLGGDKLYVFFPTTARPQVVQEKLQQAYPGVEVTVFGRLNDFTAKIEIEPPEAILTKTPLIKQFDKYVIKVNGQRDGKSEEVYVLISIDQPLTPSKVTQETIIGTIDFLGRNGMNGFIQQFFTILPKIKRVTKVEDLLPLLTFNMSNAILVEESSVDFFKKTSNLNFAISPLPATKDGIIALGTKHDLQRNKIIDSTKKLGKDASSFFGVDQWK
jgi:hypothetical protein